MTIESDRVRYNLEGKTNYIIKNLTKSQKDELTKRVQEHHSLFGFIYEWVECEWKYISMHKENCKTRLAAFIKDYLTNA